MSPKLITASVYFLTAYHNGESYLNGIKYISN